MHVMQVCVSAWPTCRGRDAHYSDSLRRVATAAVVRPYHFIRAECDVYAHIFLSYASFVSRARARMYAPVNTWVHPCTLIKAVPERFSSGAKLIKPFRSFRADQNIVKSPLSVIGKITVRSIKRLFIGRAFTLTSKVLAKTVPLPFP